MKAELNYGKKMIARNLNTYRMAIPNQDFWQEWRESKESLKAEGVSVFKSGDSFYVAYYDGGKATQEEYDAQAKFELDRVKEIVRSYIYEYEEYARKDDFEFALNVIDKAVKFADIYDICRVMNNADYIIEDAKEQLFNEELMNN